jgi:hypothetical protein
MYPPGVRYIKTNKLLVQLVLSGLYSLVNKYTDGLKLVLTVVTLNV